MSNISAIAPPQLSPTVLIVEDDTTMRILLHQAMKQEGYQVLEANNGAEALDVYSRHHPNIILLDALMPVMDGFTCCSQLQTLPEGDRTPVLMITALEDPESVDRAFAAGAIDYITKPIHWAVLRQRVRRLLQTRQALENLQTQTERMQQSEAQLRLALEAASMGTWIWDITSGNVISDTTTARNLGMLVGRADSSAYISTFEHLSARIHPEDQSFVVQALDQAIAHQTDYDLEFRVIWPDETVHWIASRGQVYGSTQDQALRMTGISMDITERKQAERKIREQAALLDVATDAILVRSLEGQIYFWNKGAERLYGWSAEEVLGQNADQLLYKRSCPHLETARHTLTYRDYWQGELSQITKDGQDIIVESRWTLVRDKVGQPKSVLTVNTNITEKKKLEAQFLRAQRVESIGTLAGGIAHDLNNVLAPILMSLQLLDKKLPDEQSQWLLKTLESNTKRASDLVRQVLSFARGLEGNYTILQVSQLVTEIEKIARETFPKSIEVQLAEFDPHLWMLSGDATQLHQVLMNLCVNARDAMPQGGVLSIQAENLMIDENYARMNLDAKAGPHVVITVVDTGIGIAPEILDRIFEPFFTTKEFGKGTGLGLSTVAAIIKSHGGFINVYSELGKGTRFRVYLPAIERHDSQPTPENQWQSFEGQGELILVVDDEETICQVTQVSLEAHNYRVLTAKDGIEAVALFAQHQHEIRVVLVDIMMPVMDGPTTIRTLRKIDPQANIIAVSGLVSSDRTLEVTESGVNTLLPKPYTTEQLLKALQSILHPSPNNEF